ncbi:MAG: hypothetical protein FWH21_07190 [Kiritimatiellaeota bacterium]|nr:hypothetical protein [Kiritimatiellota bacterium]
MNGNVIWQTDLCVPAQELQVVNLGSLAENMVLYLPGCADVMIRKSLQEVFAEFCHKTGALRMDAAVNLRRGVTRYPLHAPFNCIVESVSEVRHGSRELRAGRGYGLHDGCPPYISLPGAWVDGVLDVERSPQPAVHCSCALKPRMNSEECPDWFLQKYGYAIRAGAMARLKEMGGRPWSDPAQAAREMITYANAMNEACVAAAGVDGSVSGPRGIDCFNYGGMI